VTQLVRVHGLDVESDVWLPEPVAVRVPDENVPALRVGTEVWPSATDRHDPVLCLAVDGRVVYEAVSLHPGAWEIRVPDRVSIRADPEGLSVVLSDGVDAAWAGIFAGGLGLSFWMALNRMLVLHASAVEVDGRAIAMTAPSGCGKSTLAALAAVEGHPLVADDVLRVALEGSAATVFRGSSEIRLREGATALAANWPGASRTTVDGRSAVAPPRTEHDRLPLGAIVVPLLDRDRSDVELQPIPAGDALMLMMQCLRLVGWRDPQIVQREFEQLTDLVAHVPVILARIPWRTPAEPWIAALMLEQVRSHLS
jgi:hypothetical protein